MSGLFPQQNVILQSGDVTLNHVVLWVTDGVVKDGGVTILASSSGGINFPTNSKSGLPSTTDITAGYWGIWKNTSDNKVYVVANDGGTIKKVELT